METRLLNDRDFVGANVRRIARSLGVPAVNAELAVEEALSALARGSDRYVAVNVGSKHCARVRVAHVRPITPAIPFRQAFRQPYQPCPRGGRIIEVPVESANDPVWVRRLLGALAVALFVGAIWLGHP